jgi:hypothetical protein
MIALRLIPHARASRHVRREPVPSEPRGGIARVEVSDNSIETREGGDIVDFATRARTALTADNALGISNSITNVWATRRDAVPADDPCLVA